MRAILRWTKRHWKDHGIVKDHNTMESVLARKMFQTLPLTIYDLERTLVRLVIIDPERGDADMAELVRCPIGDVRKVRRAELLGHPRFVREKAEMAEDRARFDAPRRGEQISLFGGQ